MTEHWAVESPKHALRLADDGNRDTYTNVDTAASNKGALALTDGAATADARPAAALTDGAAASPPALMDAPAAGEEAKEGGGGNNDSPSNNDSGARDASDDATKENDDPATAAARARIRRFRFLLPTGRVDWRRLARTDVRRVGRNVAAGGGAAGGARNAERAGARLLPFLNDVAFGDPVADLREAARADDAAAGLLEDREAPEADMAEARAAAAAAAAAAGDGGGEGGGGGGSELRHLQLQLAHARLRGLRGGACRGV